MKNEKPRYTLRIPNGLLQKISYIAHFNGRTTNREIETLIRKSVQDFERSYGTIDEYDDD